MTKNEAVVILSLSEIAEVSDAAWELRSTDINQWSRIMDSLTRQGLLKTIEVGALGVETYATDEATDEAWAIWNGVTA